jgi:hypothetical protein
MEKIKVKIYKDPNNKGDYINKTAKFLQKAEYGMQKGPTEDDVIQTILDELTLDPDADSIAYKLQSNYGMSYLDAMDKIDDVVSLLYKDDQKEMIPDAEVVEEDQIEETMKPKLYSIDQPWISEESEDDAEGWGDELAMKKGGSISKKKFVKNVVGGLKKAAAGMEQEQSSESSILDTPINGRQSHINNFRRGIKDLGNEHYAKEIYESTKKLQNQVQNLPPAPMGVPMAENGFQVQEQDVENPMHHLQAYTDSVSNIFKQPMNQVHGAGYEMPQARRGREQRQADRQQRQMNKDWKGMFGDMAAGYSGVPGMPNYLQVVSPQVNVQGAPQGNQGSTGPFIDIDYKKGPWWKGNREWSAKGIPAEMLMGMSGGRGRGVNPGYGYMPGGYNYGASWSTSRTYPGEIIRSKSRAINNAADPAKNNNVTLNNNANTTKPYPGNMELNPAPNGTEMVYDAQGNEQMAISPEEAERRRAEALVTKYPWMASNEGINDFIPSETPTPQVNELRGVSKPAAITQIPQQNFELLDIGTVNAPASVTNTTDNKPKLNSTGSQTEEFCYPGQSCYNLSDDQQMDRQTFNDLPRALSVYGSKNKANWLTDNADGYPTNLDLSKVTKEEAKEAIKQQLSKDELSRIKNLDEYVDKWLKFQQDNQKAYGTTNYTDLYDYDSSGDSPKYADWLNVSGTAGAQNPYDIFSATPALDFQDYEKAYGGAIDNPQLDEYDNLQRFVYGGNDMDVSPIVAYDNNDIQTKNVDDPYMFREGGLYEAQGGYEVNPLDVNGKPIAGSDNFDPSRMSPAFKRYNSNATSESNFAAFNEMKKRGLVTGNYNPTQTYDMSNSGTTTKTYNSSGFSQGDGMGGPDPRRQQYYPTAPTPFQQVKDMFSIFKRNPETGKNYDFEWMSQQGPARTLDGKVWQPPGGQQTTQGQRTIQGQTNQGAGTNQTNPKQAGYMYDYKYEKGPWWSGKKTMTMTGKWFDPNNPNAGNTTSTNPMADGKGPVLNPNTTTNNTNKGEQPDGTRYVQGMTIGKKQMRKTNTDENGDPMGIDWKGRLVSSGAPARSTTPTTTTAPITTAPGVGTDGFVSEGEEMNPSVGFAYGGYVPEFQFAGQFNTTSGPFNPSGTPQVGGMGQGLTGPCTEAEVQDTNSPCYDPNYKPGGTGTPQDFEVSYDINKARTLNATGIANIMGGAGKGIQGISAINNNIYNDNYLNSRTTAENKEPNNELDYRGGYSGLNQRIMSKGQGAGSTGFNSVVGNAAFVKKGGQLNYQRGGEYDLTQEEIGRILAAGGQLEFIS